MCLNRRKRRSVEDEFDPFDDFEAQLEQGERGNAQVRLSTNTAIAIRQVNYSIWNRDWSFYSKIFSREKTVKKVLILKKSRAKIPLVIGGSPQQMDIL